MKTLQKIQILRKKDHKETVGGEESRRSLLMDQKQTDGQMAD